MRSKKWVISFLAILFAGIGIYMGLNYYANPLGYFTQTKGLDYYWTDDYTRSIKTRYILSHEDDFNAVVLGGSKSGALDPDQLGRYTGKKYYNFYMNIGNFSDYERFTRFFAENTDIEEITLHLSSYETLYYDRTDVGSAYKIPAVISGSRWEEFKEFLSYLMTDQETLIDTLKNRSRTKDIKAEMLTNGKRDRRWECGMFFDDAEKYVNNYVLDTYEDASAELLKSEKLNTIQEEYRMQNLESLRRIKQICDENDITLKVVIGASFIGERYYYECAEYYEYLREIVHICGQVWDFSHFCDINLNPYNFSNAKHYSLSVGDLMVDTMYGGPSREDFGVLLTMDNIDEYLRKRSSDLEEARAAITDGTLELPDMSDESYVDLSAYDTDA